MSYSSLGAQVWHVLRGITQFYQPPTIHKWNEPNLQPPAAEHSPAPHFGWYSFPVPLRVGG